MEQPKYVRMCGVIEMNNFITTAPTVKKKKNKFIRFIISLFKGRK